LASRLGHRKTMIWKGLLRRGALEQAKNCPVVGWTCR
jgi:hypothetical protein